MPRRVLFVFGWLVVGGEETEVRLLARLRTDPMPEVFAVADGFLLKLPRPTPGLPGGTLRLRALADHGILAPSGEAAAAAPAPCTASSACAGSACASWRTREWSPA